MFFFVFFFGGGGGELFPSFKNLIKLVTNHDNGTQKFCCGVIGNIFIGKIEQKKKKKTDNIV